ncbi:SymE family type I addiction module toxin [Caballeronia sp. BR00000012568055]
MHTAPFYPGIRLAGRWLTNAGFVPGQRVKVNVEHGTPVITAG